MRQGVLWTGMALILVAPLLALSAQERPAVEPLRAKIVIEHTDPNHGAGTEVGQFYRDAEGRPTRLTEVWSHGGSPVGSVAIYALPKTAVRIGTATSLEPGVGKFEFFIPTPEKPGLKKTAANP